MNYLTDIWRCILLSRNNFSFNLIFILIVTLQLMLVSFRFLKICELNELKKQENRIELFLAQKNIEERARKKMDHLKSDEDGNRPEGKWVVITTDGMNEWIYDYKDMFDAINNCDDGTVAYIICNKGTTSWYEDKKGNIFGDYDSIQL